MRQNSRMSLSRPRKYHASFCQQRSLNQRERIEIFASSSCADEVPASVTIPNIEVVLDSGLVKVSASQLHLYHQAQSKDSTGKIVLGKELYLCFLYNKSQRSEPEATQREGWSNARRLLLLSTCSISFTGGKGRKKSRYCEGRPHWHVRIYLHRVLLYLLKY